MFFNTLRSMKNAWNAHWSLRHFIPSNFHDLKPC